MGKISAIVDFRGLKMQNFDGEHPQGIERASCGCVILLGSIFTLSKTWDVDARFAKEVSLNPRKSKMQIQLYMIGRLKRICKFKEKQIADYLGLKNSICNSEYQALQIQRLPQRYLQHSISEMCRYMRCQRLFSKALLFNSSDLR